MTLQISTNPRFADNGDIGACDRSLITMVEPLAEGDTAPPRGHTRVQTPFHKPSNFGDQGSIDPHALPTEEGSSTALPSQIPAVAPTPAPLLLPTSAPLQSREPASGRAEPELGSALDTPTNTTTLQTVIISSPACPASPSCTEDACTSLQVMGHKNAISDRSSTGEESAAVRDPNQLKMSDGAPSALIPPTHLPQRSLPLPPPPSPSTDLVSAEDITPTMAATTDNASTAPQQKQVGRSLPILTNNIPLAGSVPPAITTTTTNNNSFQLDDNTTMKPTTGAGRSQSTPTSSATSISSFNKQTANQMAATLRGCQVAEPAAAAALVQTSSTASLLDRKYAGSCDLYKSLSPKSSSSAAARLTGWCLPPGGGLRGGAPQPGETSAISNGTTGWGPPPSNNPGNSVVGGWGTAPPSNQGAVSAWGGNPAASNTEDVSNGQKLLNSGLKVSSSPAASSMSAPVGQAPPTPAPATSSTSWAAAAGKGLPPSEPNAGQMNGATNKQLEQLNSVREALFSQDGWGGQHVKQDTSWDVGGAIPEPSSAPPPPSKSESMQWQAPSTGRNDGTDLWKSTLSGVPQAPKTQQATPWGNHTPAHPADYKTWGEPDEEPNADRSGGGAGGIGGSGGVGPGGNGNVGGNVGGGGPSWGGPGGPGDDGPGNSGMQPWDADRGPNKPKEDNWNSNSGSQWNPGPPSRPQEGGWGPPPPIKPSVGNAGGPGGGWNSQQQWQSESPTIGRRFDDGGWKDMPMPNMGSRGGPPGPPSRLPPNGMKPGDTSSPWGQPPHPPRGGWVDEPNNPWMDDKNPSMGGAGGGGGWGPAGGGNGVDTWSNSAVVRRQHSSPSWDQDPANVDSRWNSGPRSNPQFSKEAIWGSKQFRILVEMGYRKEDVETALRNTNLQLEDALEILTRISGGGGNGPLPPRDLGFPGARTDPSYDSSRFPGGPGGMPFPPNDINQSNSSLQSNAPNRDSLNSALVQQMSMAGPGPGGAVHPGGAQPRPAQSGHPTTTQLRLLVQQIQMAVQAGHLNAQILNQPLAPQTLLLLNQLLQQIKALQQCQQQYQAAARVSTGPNNHVLLQISVQLSKHKQQISNLQNQITAQQAQYLKNQQPGGGGGGLQCPPGTQDRSDLSSNIANLSLADQQQQQLQSQQQQASVGESKLNKWIKNDIRNDPDFSRAPGSNKSSTSQASPNLLLDPVGPWSNGNNGAPGSGTSTGGWPDSGNNNDKSSRNNSDDTDFGIPEFVPGKAWKGTSIKDPSEDPNLTPGSVASSSIILQPGSSGGVDKTCTTIDNSFGLTSPTWSYGNNKEAGGVGVKDNSWGMPPSSGSNTNLTAMGHDLWGQSRAATASTNGSAVGVKPAHTPTSSSGGGGWPTVSTAGVVNGWSNGINMQPGAGNSSNTSSSSGSSWLLLRNLTAQIDGSTLRTLCMQHGPLKNFHLYLTHGIALAQYNNGSEAKKAQNALNNCVLGNTTILAEVAPEHEVESILQTLSQAGSSGGAPGQSRGGPSVSSAVAAAASFSSYSGGLSTSSSVDTWSTGLSGSTPWPTTGLGGSVWGAPDDQHNRTTPLNSFLPPDLLSETM